MPDVTADPAEQLARDRQRLLGAMDRVRHAKFMVNEAKLAKYQYDQCIDDCHATAEELAREIRRSAQWVRRVACACGYPAGPDGTYTI